MKRLNYLIFVSLVFVFLSLNLSFAQQQERKARDIHTAISTYGDLDQVKSFLANGTDINSKNRLGGTPLHTAMLNDKWEIVEFLISKNPDFNARNRDGKTPLYIAVEKNKKELVEVILTKNVDVNAVARGGQNAFSLANSLGYTEMVALIQQHGGTEPVLDMEGDGYYGQRSGAPQGGAPGQGGPQPMLQPRPTNEPSVLEDPNEVKTRVKTFAGLEKAIKLEADKGTSEERQWRQTRYDNRAMLSKAVQRQFDAEMALIKKIATEEKAKQTIAAIDNLVSQKQERSKKVYRELVQLRRNGGQDQGMGMVPGQMQSMGRGGGRGRSSGRGGRGRSSMQGGQMGGDMGGYYGEGGDMMGRSSRTRPTRPQDQIDPQTEAEIRLWSSASTDRRNDLLDSVHEQIMVEMTSIRYTANEEEAKKTTATIDGLMLVRLERYDQLVLKMEEDARKAEERQLRLEQRGRGRGMQGDSTHQNTQQRGRGRRR